MTTNGRILWSNYFYVAFFCIAKRWVWKRGSIGIVTAFGGFFYTFKVRAIFCINFYNGFLYVSVTDLLLIVVFRSFLSKILRMFKNNAIFKPNSLIFFF
jgi:hypothetical protein